MRCNLVYSPFVLPTYPLGVSCLKAYVQEHSTHRVKCLDLNAVMNDWIIQEIDKGGISFTASGKADGDIRGNIGKALEAFRGSPAFFDQDTYNDGAGLAQQAFWKTYDTLHEECLKMISGKVTVPGYIQECCRMVLAGTPDVVGFSLLFPRQYYISLLMARIIKSMDRRVRIVFGGNFVSSGIHEEILESPFIDFIVLKEGEQTLLELLNILESDGDFGTITGLVWKDGGKVMVNGERPGLSLDDLPFADFSDFDQDMYFSPEQVIPILTSRGCYWRRCAFCNHFNKYADTYRVTGVQRVVDELEHHARNGIRYFDWVDEMVSPARFKKIGEEIIRRKLDITYYALAMPTAHFTREILDIMYRSGCRYIMWGFESGSQRVLDMIDKGTVVGDIAEVMKNSAGAGIKNHLYVIIGFPTETAEEMRQTLDFLYDNREHIHLVMSGRFHLTRDSRIFANLADYGIIWHEEKGPNLILYKVAQGLDHGEGARCHHFYHDRFFSKFSYFSYWHAFFRQHALVIYSNPDKVKFSVVRERIPSPGELGDPFAGEPEMANREGLAG